MPMTLTFPGVDFNYHLCKWQHWTNICYNHLLSENYLHVVAGFLCAPEVVDSLTETGQGLILDYLLAVKPWPYCSTSFHEPLFSPL